jgi:hypothetical protein
MAGVEEAADEGGLGLGESSERDGETEAEEHRSVPFFQNAGEGDVGLRVDGLASIAGFGN